MGKNSRQGALKDWIKKEPRSGHVYRFSTATIHRPIQPPAPFPGARATTRRRDSASRVNPRCVSSLRYNDKRSHTLSLLTVLYASHTLVPYASSARHSSAPFYPPAHPNNTGQAGGSRVRFSKAAVRVCYTLLLCLSLLVPRFALEMRDLSSPSSWIPSKRQPIFPDTHTHPLQFKRPIQPHSCGGLQVEDAIRRRMAQARLLFCMSLSVLPPSHAFRATTQQSDPRSLSHRDGPPIQHRQGKWRLLQDSVMRGAKASILTEGMPLS